MFTIDIPGATLGDTDAEGEIDALADELGDVLAEGETDRLADALGERDAEGLTLADTEAEAEELGESDALGLRLGEGELDGVKSVKINHDIAPSSPLVPPLQVTAVAIRAVVLVAVVNLRFPTSASISSVALAHVFATVSVAPTATAINPPPVGIVIAPVVSGSVTSISVEPSPPAEEKTPSTTE